MQTVNLPFNVRKTDEKGYFSGYASIFDIQDAHNDTIQARAFQKSLDQLEKNSQMPKMLWQHDHNFPIGIWTFIEEDSRGLYVEGKLLLDVQKAKEAYVLLKARAIGGLSIGYTVRTAQQNPYGGRHITEIDLHEISIVTFASNAQAQVLGVKRMSDIS